MRSRLSEQEQAHIIEQTVAMFLSRYCPK